MEHAPSDFGYGGENDWPIVISCKGRIYGEGALAAFRKEKPGQMPHFGTANSAQKWVDKTYRRIKKAERR